jgi:hypothetical protein
MKGAFPKPVSGPRFIEQITSIFDEEPAILARILFSSMLIACVLVHPVSAQGHPAAAASDPSLVTIVLKDSFPHRKWLGVLRRSPRGTPTNAIALRRDAATPALLASVLRALRDSRVRHGDVPSGQIVVLFPVKLGGGFSPAELSTASAILAQLTRGRPENVATIGNVRSAVVVPIPPN